MHRRARWVLTAAAACTVAAGALAPSAAHAAVTTAPPECESRTLTVAPDGSRALPLACVDRDRFPAMALDYAIVDAPQHGDLGAVNHTTQTIRYTPDPGFTGTDALTFRASDGAETTGDVTLTLLVTDAPQAPICDPGPHRIREGQDSAYPCYDPDEGDAVELEVRGPAAHGTVTRNANGFFYAVTGDFRGPDSFLARATDGTRTSEDVVIELDVARAAPVVCNAPDAPIGVRPDGERRLRLRCHHDGWSPGTWSSYVQLEPPAHGTFHYVGDDLAYVPDPGYTGPDTALLRPTDGRDGSDPVRVDFTVAHDANAAPVCEPSPVTLARPGRTAYAAACSDPDGDPLTVALVDPPEHGTFTAPEPDVGYGTYVADEGAEGEDAFTFTASDDRGATSAPVRQTMRILGTGEDHAPVCTGGAFQTFRDRPTTGAAGCFDEESDPYTVEYTAPQHGTRTADGWSWSYTPLAGWTGTDAFQARAGAGTLWSPWVPQRVRVVAPGKPRCAPTPPRTVRAGIRTWFGFDCTADADWPAFAVKTPPQKGTLEPTSGGWFTYQPRPGATGADAFTISARNAEGATDATQQVTIDPDFNTAPTCSVAEAVTREQTPVALDLHCWDAEHDEVARAITHAPASGALTGLNAQTGAVTYTPKEGFVGTDTLTFRGTDARGADSDDVTLKISVRAAARNAAPICDVSAGWTSPGVATAAPISCRDPDGDALTYEIVEAPGHGTAEPTDHGTFAYTPHPRFLGEDALWFVARDPRGLQSKRALVRFYVEGERGAPSCLPVTATTGVGLARPVQLSCAPWGIDGTPMTIEVVTGPAHGTLSAIATDGSVTYTPAAGWAGTDTFTYRAVEGGKASAPATATITVTRPPAPDPGDEDEEERPRDPGNDAGGGDERPRDTGTGTGAAPRQDPQPPAPPAEQPRFSQPSRREAPATLAGRALGGRALFVRRIGNVRVYRRAGARTRTRELLALVCASPKCTAIVRPSVGGRRGRTQLLRFTADRPGLVTARLSRRLRRATVRFTITAGGARGGVRLSLRR